MGPRPKVGASSSSEGFSTCDYTWRDQHRVCNCRRTWTLSLLTADQQPQRRAQREPPDFSPSDDPRRVGEARVARTHLAMNVASLYAARPLSG